MESSEQSDDITKEVVSLVKELTREVLIGRPSNVLDCCALYLERKLRQRDGSQTLSQSSGQDQLFLKTRLSSPSSNGDVNTSQSYLSTSSVDRAITQAGLGNAVVAANVVRLSRASIRSITPHSSPTNNKSPNQESGTAPGKFGVRKIFKDASSDESPDREDYNKPKSKYDSGISSPTSSTSSVPKESQEWRDRDIEALPEVETRTIRSSRGKLQRDSTILSSADIDPEPDNSNVAHIRPQLVCTLVGHRNLVTQCHISAQHVISSSVDTTVRVWDRATGNQLAKLKLQKPVLDFEYIVHETGDTVLLAGCEDGKLCSYKILEGEQLVCKQVGEYAGHLPNPIRAMTYSTDHKHLATGCCFMMKQIVDGRIQDAPVLRGTLKVFDLESIIEDTIRNDGHFTDKGPELVKTMHQLVATTVVRRQLYATRMRSLLEEKAWGIRALCYTPDGSMIGVGFGHPDDDCVEDEKFIVIVSAKNLEPLWTDSSVVSQVNFLEIPLSSNSVMSPCSSHGSSDSKKDSSTGRFKMLISTQSSLMKMVFSIKGKKLEGRYCWKRSVSEDHFCGRKCSGSRLVVSADSCSLVWWDYHTGRRLGVTPGAHKDIISKLAISPDDASLVTASDDKTLNLWKMPKLDKGKLYP